MGKNENGIAAAIKPKLKFDLAGIGHKDSEFEWWNSVYDKAQKNVVIEKQSDEVSFKLANKNAFNISTTKNGLEVPINKQNFEYGKFLKTSTLRNGKLIKEDTCEVIENKGANDLPVIQMTDEELFNACGGRTAHKGARHGLTLSGKLARVAEQEKQLLDSKYLKSDSQNLCCKKEKRKKRSKKKKDSKSSNILQDDYVSDENDATVCTEAVKSKLPKNSRKKLRRSINCIADQLSKSCSIEDNPSQNNEDILDKNNKNHDVKLDSATPETKSKKKSKRKRNIESLDDTAKSLLGDDIPTNQVIKKTKKSDVDPLVRDLFFTQEEQEAQTESICDIKTSKKRSKKVGAENNCKTTFSCIISKADKLNSKISIKKERKLKKKEHRKIEELSKTLFSINLSSDSTVNDVTEKIKFSKKSRKRKKNKK